MKKILLVIAVFAGVQHAFSQNKFLDSLKGVLAATTDPSDRFSLMAKISENSLLLDGHSIDSASTIEMLQIAQRLKKDSLLAISYNWIGDYLALTKGDNVSGLEYCFRALPLAEKAKDKRRISSLYLDIATMHMILQNSDEAIKNIRKAGENLPDTSSPMHDFMLVQYQTLLAGYYSNTGRQDSALHYAQALSEISHRIRSSYYEANAAALRAKAYAQKGENELAAAYFKKALTLSDSVKLNSYKQFLFEGYIRFLLSVHQTNEARVRAHQLFDIGNLENNSSLKQVSAGLLRQVFDSLRRFDSAYFYARIESALDAKIFSEDNTAKIQSLVFSEQLRQIEEKAKEAGESEQRRLNIQYILISLGILFLMVLYLALSRSMITSTKMIEFLGVVALLIVFEFLNLLLHPLLERVTNHSPLLMLLALVCIAFLIVPLHHKVEKWTTSRLIEKNKAIRLAAAKRTISELES